MILVMMVTGVQPAGARGVGTLQAVAVDTKELTRSFTPADKEQDGRVPYAKSGTPQPVVFPREGVPLDQRPVSQRLHEAGERYRADGGHEQQPEDRDGDTPDRW